MRATWFRAILPVVLAAGVLAIPALGGEDPPADHPAASRPRRTTSSRSASRCTTTTTTPRPRCPPTSSTRTASRCLSWRVAILPYIEQDDLYKQFKLDEPWDSEHNKKLIDEDAEDLRPRPREGRRPGETFYQVFTGEKATLRAEEEAPISRPAFGRHDEHGPGVRGGRAGDLDEAGGHAVRREEAAAQARRAVRRRLPRRAVRRVGTAAQEGRRREGVEEAHHARNDGLAIDFNKLEK